MAGAKTAHMVYGAILFVVAALIFATTFSAQYADEPLGDDVSTVFLPRIYLVLWMFFAALVFLMGWRGADVQAYPAVDWMRLAGLALTGVIVAWAMLEAGFLIATIPGVWVFTWIFGYRKPVALTIFSVVLPLAVWFVFIDVFELLLPSSPWFDSF